ncbi:MAG: PD-(D/E)XK nuclease family protein [Bacteroidia bacterium]
MQSFLYQLAKILQTRFGDQISDICVVFPTRRARLFFMETLSEVYAKPILAPHIFSIEDFIRECHPAIFPENIHLIFELHSIYLNEMRKKVPNYHESFDQFYPWGEMLLSDFNEIDKYCANAKQLYRNVLELREIDESFGLPEEMERAILDFWRTISLETPTQLQSDFLKIWEVLHDVYLQFSKTLKQKNWSYEGKAYREIADAIKNKKIELPYSFVVFAGLNALAKSEEIIIEALLKQKKAVVYWDADEYYMKDRHSPGKYILLQHKDWIKSKYESYILMHEMEKEPKKIHIVGCPQNSGQTRYVGEMIQHNLHQEMKQKLANQPISPLTQPELLVADKAELRKHVVILGDENLLFPTLYSLPKNVGKLNITMGFPLKYTNVYHLLMGIMRLVRNMKNEKSGNPVFHYKTILEVLQNPFVKSLAMETVADLQRIFSKENLIYANASFLKKFNLPPFLENIFTPPTEKEGIFPYFENIFSTLLQAAADSNMVLESEYIYFFYRQFNVMRAALTSNPLDISLKTFAMTFREAMRKLSIPFEGEPVEGLQIMGFLESRVLDFEYVYIMAVNDKNIPGSSTLNSFIPNNLRTGFGLPTGEDKDIIFSYHFYRLMQRTKEIYLVYNSEVETAGEMSRFILQIQHDFADNPNIEIHAKHIVHTPKSIVNQPIRVAMTEDIQNKLKTKFDTKVESTSNSALSATAFSDYLTCPLRFYFKYVAELREKGEISEDIDPLTFGILLHETMQYLYEPLKRLLLSAEEIGLLKRKVKEAVTHAFAENGYRQEEGLYGRNFLFQNIIESLCKKILSQDQKIAPFRVEFVEQRGTFATTLALPDLDLEVRIDGNFDRLDKTNECYRIIDYKTGETDVTDQDISDCFDAEKSKRAVLQGYLYGYLFSKKYPNHPVQVGYYSAKNLKDGLKYLNKATPISENNIRDFETEMQGLVRNIFTEDFTQTLDAKKCEYCSFKEICNR